MNKIPVIHRTLRQLIKTILLFNQSTLHRFTLILISGLLIFVSNPGFAQEYTQISVGTSHSCALTATGGVKCWGDNQFYQLGNGTQIASSTPVDVIGLEQGVTAISAGSHHTCALTTLGGVKCWGLNGRLGNGSNSGVEPLAVDVLGLDSGVIEISAAAEHSCALMSDGTAKCWGSNRQGALGDGTTQDSLVPVNVTVQPSGITAITNGTNFTCVLVTGGWAKCWGTNGLSQLGDGSSTSHTNSTHVWGLTSGNVKIKSGDFSSCVITGDGGAKCWGLGGTLGDGFNQNRTSAVNVVGITAGAINIAAGYGHFCTVIDNQGVKCWGRNQTGVIGDNSTTNRLSPVTTHSLPSTIRSIDGGHYHTCAVMSDGQYNCWGLNNYGQLGDGTQLQRLTPLVSPAPGAPVIGTAIAGNTEAIVRFSPPLDDGGAPITGYTVMISPMNVATDVQRGTLESFTGSNDLSHLITGLVNGVGYSFTVTATNALGTGLPSAVSNMVIPSASNSSFSTSSVSNSVPPSLSSSSRSVNVSSTPTSSTPTSSTPASSSVASSVVVASSSSISSVPISSSSIATSSVGAVNNCGTTGVTFGITSNGSLATNDCTAGARGANYYTDRYSFTGTPGQQIAIQLSGSFDTFVNLKNPAGSVIASNDDGGGGTNSRIPATSGNFTIPAGATGTYVIEVTSYSTFAIGSYSLTVTSAVTTSSSSSAVTSSSSVSSSSSANPCSSSLPAVSGVTNTGTLVATDCNNGARGAGYFTDRYTFAGTSGQLISIQLTSGAFDSYVYLRNPSGLVITSDDDGGGGTNSRIPATSGNFALTTSGTYVIEVTSYSSSRTGAYSLLLTRQ